MMDSSRVAGSSESASREIKKQKLDNLPQSQKENEELDSVACRTEGKEEKFWTLQTSNCLATPLQVAGVSSCHKCAGAETSEICLFQELRSLNTEGNNDGSIVSNETRIFCSELPDHQPRLFQDFEEHFDVEQAKVIKRGVARHLLPAMKVELAIATERLAIRLTRDLSSNFNCDGCKTSLFISCYLCTLCAREFCSQCKDDIRSGDSKRHTDFVQACYLSPHSNNHYDSLIPAYRMDIKEMTQLIGSMKQFLQEDSVQENIESEIDPDLLKSYYEDSTNTTRTSELTSRPFLKVPSLDIDDPSKEEETLHLFSVLWLRGEPMLVDVDLGQLSRKEWTGEAFLKEFGTQNCKIESSIPGKPSRKAKVAEYFGNFGRVRVETEVLRITDWPSKMDFKTMFFEHFLDFMDILPVKCVTQRDGIFNLSSHFVINSRTCKPDLGPKFYISYVGGMTTLHMDAADAVNLMASSAACPDGTPGFAIWHMFRAEDSKRLREFLTQEATDKKNREYQQRARLEAIVSGVATEAKFIGVESFVKKHKDSIHGFQSYLHDDQLARLLEKTGIRPWIIKQRIGQMIFIPAGVAHQVRNYSDSIKIACDFVSMENIPRMLILKEEFRKETNMKTLWKSDILQLHSLLLWSWLSASRFAL